MRAFFELFAEGGCPRFRRDELVERVGAEVWKVLRAERVLVDLEPVRSYECGGWEGNGCPREVYRDPSPHHPGAPYVAVCGNDAPHCESLRLSEAELTFVGTSLYELGALVARLYGVRDPSPREVDDFPSTYSLGHGAAGGELVLLSHPSRRSGRVFMRTLREPTRVLAPTRAGVSRGLIERYAVGGRVELRFLADELTVGGGRVRRLASSDVGAAEPARSRWLVDAVGRRAITDREYDDLMERRSELDLCVDLSAPVSAARCAVTTRELDGSIRESTVSVVQARALLELASSRKPLRPSRLRAFSEAQITAPARRIETLRKAIDVVEGWRAWRFIHTVSGARPEAREYHFNPAPELAFALIERVKRGDQSLPSSPFAASSIARSSRRPLAPRTACARSR